MPGPRLSVVLPVYDEAQVLEANLAAIVAWLEAAGLDFELVCVDDGSTDGSGEILARAAARDPRVRAESSPENRGKGAAVRRGMLLARGRHVVFMDADLSTPLDELPRLLEALEAGNDVVLGNRRAPGSRITRRQSRVREVLGRAFTGLTRLLLAPGIHDFTCGFKGFTAEAAGEIFRRSLQDGWAFDAELVVIARGLGYRVAQVPVTWHHEEGSKVRVLPAVLASLRELSVILWNQRRGRYR